MSTGPLVVAFGGGVNSTAMLVGMGETGMQPDLILFADTGGEKPETYDFIAQMGEWTIRELGREIVTVMASTKTDASLEANCLRLGNLPSIVYGGHTCSQRWKLEPCEKFINHWNPAIEAWSNGNLVLNAKGIDAGELHRAKDFSDSKFQVIYPLIDWRWDRRACIAAIERSGLSVPPKSACFFCPSSRKHEVIQLKDNHPSLFARAVAMEHAAAEKLVNIRGLGRRWSWEEIGRADDQQLRMFHEAVQIPCVCFDGDSDEGGV